MPEWCPKCHVMLPTDSKTCPACGAKISKPTTIEGWTSKELWELIFLILKFALVPLMVGLLLAFICVITTNH